MRVVSLLPAATEVVYALGREPVGVSHECDFPPAASEKPAMLRCRIDTAGSSGAIHDRVESASEGSDLYEIDDEALMEADPDLIITQGVCEVCAVDDVRVADTVERLDLDAEILTTDPHTLEDVFDDIRRIGEAIGAQDRARELVADLTGRLDDLASRIGPVNERPRVLVLDWMDPPMVGGHWVPDLIELAGGEPGVTDAGGYSAPQDWAAIRDFDPEVLVAAPCGFTLEETVRNTAELTERDGWESITAVRDGRAYAMDGHHFVNRPGPRLVDTAEYLAGVIHPSTAPPADETVMEPITPRNRPRR